MAVLPNSALPDLRQLQVCHSTSGWLLRAGCNCLYVCWKIPEVPLDRVGVFVVRIGVFVVSVGYHYEFCSLHTEMLQKLHCNMLSTPHASAGALCSHKHHVCTYRLWHTAGALLYMRVTQVFSLRSSQPAPLKVSLAPAVTHACDIAQDVINVCLKLYFRCLKQ